MPCYRYTLLKHYHDLRACIAHLTGWTVGGMTPGLDKLGEFGHINYEPDADIIDKVEPYIPLNLPEASP